MLIANGLPAAFIWTPRQPIDPDGFFAGLDPDRPARTDGRNRWYLFRREFTLDAAARAAQMAITADGLYRLWINGAHVAYGPARSSPLYKRYDVHDVAALLTPGPNVIAVLVHVPGIDLPWYERVRGLWAPTFGDGGLWVEMLVGTAQGDVAIESDDRWRCRVSDAWVSDAPRASHGGGFIESVDGALLPGDWHYAGFDDIDWDQTVVQEIPSSGPEGFWGGMGVRPFPQLQPSIIRVAEGAPQSPARCLWIGSLIADPTLPWAERLYRETITTGSVEIAGLDAMLAGAGEARIATTPGRDAAMLFDFGTCLTGRPFIELTAKGGEWIEIAVSEQLDGDATPQRIAMAGSLGTEHYLWRYRARPGRQRFDGFAWRSVRYLQLAVRDAPEGISVHALGVVPTGYDARRRGSFACSDLMLTRLWEAGARTITLCMQDGWIDCPGREQRQWLGDALVEHLAARAVFGSDIDSLNATFLQQAAESQRSDGLTQMFAPGDHHHDWLVSPDWTLLWIINAADHYRFTGDMHIAEDIFPAMLKALAWFERLPAPHGLPAGIPYWNVVDWAGVDRGGESAVLCLMLAGAYRATATIAEALGWQVKATALANRADALAASVDTRHWDEARGVWVDRVDPETSAQAPRVSQHATAAMLLWGNAAPERRQRALAYITDPARVTVTAAPPIVPVGEPLEVNEGVVSANTFFSHFVGEALASEGQIDAMLGQLRGRYAEMIAAGATTLWESRTPTGSLCHGFSASPVWQLSRHVLGIDPAPLPDGTIGVTPALGDLDWAEGCMPTAAGSLFVRVEQGQDELVVDLRAEDQAMTIVLAGRERIDLVPGMTVRCRIAAAGDAIIEIIVPLLENDT
jgi:alpha-L-rhamnosidase